MSIYIVGSGSREQTIKETLERTSGLTDIVISDKLPKNDQNIDMVILGSEEVIMTGYKEFSQYNCFSPSLSAAKIEGCKIFSKQFMKQNNISTVDFQIFHNKYTSYKFISENFRYNKYVIKLPGLEKGKGVYVPETITEALSCIDEIYKDKLKRDIIIENRVYGTEVSVMAFCNGKDVKLMPQAIDYKRIYDDDLGPNTGGMGSIAPVNVLDDDDLWQLKQDMLKVVKNLDFRGVLYAGVMKTPDNYYILEFNCRFGDPETQVVLNLLDSDLYKIMKCCINGEDMDVKWNDNKSACVVMSHNDYPFSKLKTPVKVDIGVLENTKIYSGNLKNSYTTGGRVVSLVSVDSNITNCLENIYNDAPKITYQGKYYRRDIGMKYLISHNNPINLKIGIIGSTKGTSIKKLLNHHMDMNVNVEVIISSKPSDILEKGKERSMPSFYIPFTQKNKESYYDKLTNLLMVYDLDIILCVGFMNIIPVSFCDKFRGKLFNIHPSLLPRHKGLCGINVHKSVLDSQDSFTGCTIHEITENVDDGRIKLQKQCKVQTNDPHKLKQRVQELENDAIIEFVKLQQNLPLTYKNAGVNIEQGNDFVELIKDDNIGDFCGLFELGNHKLGVCCDGVGTKLDIANKYNKLDNIGIDLVAMCVNDLIVRGFKPKAFLDYIAQEKLDQTKLVTIINSIKEGCKLAGCDLLGGETAEMPNIYFNNGFDLAGFSIGVLGNELYPKTSEITKGCNIYGLKSNGIHSNGYSLVRKLLKYYDYDIDTLLKPTKIYTECFDIMSKYQNELLGMAHITGGGIIDNILRIMPYNLNLTTNIPIENEFLWIMENAKLTKNEMLRTYNCGYGIALIFREGFVTDEFDKIGEIV